MDEAQTGQAIDEVLGGHNAHGAPGEDGCAADVGGEGYVVHGHQGVVVGYGLGVDHVEGCAADPALTEGLDYRVGVDNRAAGDIDQDGGRLHLSQGVGVDEVAGLGGQRAVQGHVVGLGQEVVEG